MIPLAQIVDSLARPASIDGLFAGRTLEQLPNVRVGVDARGNPGVFFELTSAGGARRSFMLAAVTYEPDVLCGFDDDGVKHRCAVLRCTTTEVASRDLFLRVVDAWLATAPRNGIGAEIDDAIARLVDLFDALARPGRGEVLGLWGELFVILAADDPKELIRAWRCDPFELHDFVSMRGRLEVKTAIGARRHHFGLDQLRSPSNASLFIASVVTKASARGESVRDLQAELVARLQDPQVAFRIEQTIAATLGERWAETTSQRYSAEHAAASLLFFDSAMIPSIDPRIPAEVSDVRFAVELDTVPSASVDFPGLGGLRGLHRYTVLRGRSP